MVGTVENWALHAYADGELEVEDRRNIERLLAESDSARYALSAINYQKSELHKAYDGALEEPVPRALIAAAKRSMPRRLAPYWSAIAAAVMLVVGAVSGFEYAQFGPTKDGADFAHRATVAYQVYSVETRHPVEVAANEQMQLQTWLSNRVGAEFTIPDLTSQGYSLLGGRLLVENELPGGQLMYETADKRRLTIFLSANSAGKDESLRLQQAGTLITCYWRDGKLAMAVTGELPRESMMTLAKGIYDQMDKET